MIVQEKIRVYTAERIKELYGIHPAELTNLARAQKIRRAPVPGSRRYVYYADDVDQFVAERKNFDETFKES